MTPDRDANARRLEQDLANLKGEIYAALIARAGTIRTIRRIMNRTERQEARDDGLEDGLLVACCIALERIGCADDDAERIARSDLAQMTDAIEQDEREFLNDPAWQRPTS